MGAVLMWVPLEDPEMIVKTLSSEIRKGFAEGVSRGHQHLRDSHTQEAAFSLKLWITPTIYK